MVLKSARTIKITMDKIDKEALSNKHYL
jgi:hypothetical protein